LLSARWYGAGDVRLEEVAEPVPGPGEVLVEVACAGICGTDVREYKDGPHMIRGGPVTLGHEWSGRVSALGPEVSGIEAGGRVCGDACIRCGTCEWCRRGEYNICRTGASVGLHRDGAFARYLTVPAYTLVPLPDSVSDAAGALVEPLAVGLHAVRQGRVTPGDTVAVVGFGMVGCAALLGALAAGAARVAVVEPRPERMRLAVELGGEPAERARFDVVIECSGLAEAMPTALEMVRRGGRLVLAGIAHTPATLDLGRIVYFEREVIGALGYRYDLERVVALLAAGRLDISPLLRQSIPLAAILSDGFERSLHDPGAPLRVLVAPV
jgi:(R,R)-butanediol dehydrogenase/meso-butanediol dehydrogenase/diacetyl reductase